jgi:hypothetical protein
MSISDGAHDPSARYAGTSPSRIPRRGGSPFDRNPLRPQVLKLTDRNSIAKEGEAFQPMSLRLAVKVAFWCSTV